MPNLRLRQSGLFSCRRGWPFGGEILWGWVLLWATLALASCATRVPETRTEPKSEIVVPEAPRLSLKAHHRSMREGMEQSFDKADEIIIGIYTGTHTDGPEGRTYYFDQFRIFNKSTWVWGSEMSALLPVLFQDVKPEIVTAPEFKSLSDLDRTGICWDDYEGPRVVFLVEGIRALVFLKQTFDESENSSRRFLIDTYPMTKECRAKDVFDLMLRDRANKREGDAEICSAQTTSSSSRIHKDRGRLLPPTAACR